MAKPWVVPAVVVAVTDGDSLRADLDVGWYLWKRNEPIRLAHADAPELSTPAGQLARAAVLGMLPIGTAIVVTSHALDKFRRTLASITLPDGRDLATVLIAEGHATPYEGGPR